jgi:hypothetical protein
MTARPRTIARAALAIAVAAVGLAFTPQATSADTTGRCPSTSTAAPIVGSWYAEVKFVGDFSPGKVEATMITFTPGGGIVEANPINPSPAGNSGHWKQNSDCSYSVRLFNFTWDPATTGVTQVLEIRLRFVMTDPNHFHSTEANALVLFYEPRSGQQLGSIAVPDVSVTTGERFNTWQVPTAFPPQP